MSKNRIAILFFVVSIVAALIYYLNLPSPDIEPKGGEDITTWVSLITAVVSLLTSIVTLIAKWFETKKERAESEL